MKLIPNNSIYKKKNKEKIKYDDKYNDNILFHNLFYTFYDGS